jgi:multidrug efflux pump subunit AcrB
MLKDLFYRNKRLTVIFLLMIIVGSLAAMTSIPRQEDPYMTSRFGVVNTYFPGASAEKIEALVTEKIEEVMNEVEEIKEIKSYSKTGFSLVRLEFEDYVQGNEAAELVWSKIQNKLSEARLPAGATEPMIYRQKVFVFTVMAGLTWDEKYGPIQIEMLSRYATELERILAPMPSVVETKIFGEPVEEVVVSVDPVKLTSVGLSMKSVSGMISAADTKSASGQFHSDKNNFIVELDGELTGVSKVREIILKRNADGSFLRLGDIAAVEKNIRKPIESFAYLEGEQGIIVGTKVAGDVRVDLWVEKVKAKISEFGKSLPDGVEVNIVFDQNIYTEVRLGGLIFNVFLGMIIIVGIIVFMMGWRSALLVGAALPLTLMMVLIGFNIFGIRLHQMSVTGLVIALGLLIDNAIVSVDEYRKERERGRDIAEAIRKMVTHLRIPLLASCVTTALTFMPVVLMPGPAGEFVGAIGKAVILAIFSSLFLSLTIIPAFAGYFDKMGIKDDRYSIWNNGFKNDEWREKFREFLNWAIKKPKNGVLLAIVIPIIGFGVAGTLINQFFPPVDRDQFQIQFTLDTSASFDKTFDGVKKIRKILKKYPEIISDNWFMGENPPNVFYNTILNQDGTSNSAGGFIQTTSAVATRKILGKLQLELRRELPDALVLVMPFEQGPPFEAPVEIHLYGQDLKILGEKAEEIRAILAVSKNVTYSKTTMTVNKPQLNFTPDKAAADMAGLNMRSLSAELNSRLEGIISGSVLEGKQDLKIRLRTAGEDRSNLQNIMSNPVGLNNGSGAALGAPLSTLGKMELVSTVSQIIHLDGRRLVTASANIMPFTLPEITLTDFLSRLEKSGFEMPEGYELQIGGEAMEREKSEGGMFGTMGPLMVIMVGVLALAFNSFTSAGIISLVAMLSAGLGLFSIWIFGYPMGFTGIMGIMGLIGLAINDSIVVLAALRANPKARDADADAIIETVIYSSRHIFSTTLTTIGGFLPLIFFGSSMWPPLAIAISGGMVGATILALIFVPSLYYVRVRKRARKMAKETTDTEQMLNPTAEIQISSAAE